MPARGGVLSPAGVGTYGSEALMEDPAIARFKEMLAKDPRSMAFAPLAEAYRKSGRLDEAIAVAEAGLRAHPGYLGGLVVLGRALFDKGDVPRAFEILGKVVRENPDNYMAAKTLAKIHVLRGEAGQALAAYRTVRAMMPGDREVEAELARLEEAAAEAAKAAPALSEPPPPPPPPAPVRPAQPPLETRGFDLPAAVPEAAPPRIVTAAELPANPFQVDEDVRSLLGHEGGLGGEDDTELPGAGAGMAFAEELPPIGGVPGRDIGDGAEAPKAPDPAPAPASGPVTETLARLYAQQGAEQQARR